MRGDEDTCDIVFIVESQIFPVHRCVLVASSDVFKGLLAGGFKESSQSYIVIKERGAFTFKALLDYLYYEPIQIGDTESELKLLAGARFYQVEDFSTDIFTFLESTLHKDYCCTLGMGAVIYAVPHLRA